MKRIVLKNNQDGSIEPFTELKQLFEVYPELSEKYDSIVYWLSRKKQPCEIFEGFTITRQLVNSSKIILS